MDGQTLGIFEWIPAELIHDMGLAVMVLVVAAGIAGIGSMARGIARREGEGLRSSHGASVLIVDRYRKTNRSVRSSTTADWLLLSLLWVTAVTGFAIELALYLPGAPAWGYWLFLVHVAIAMELVLLAPFMKLAHAVYRPVSLFFVALSRQPAQGARQ